MPNAVEFLGNGSATLRIGTREVVLRSKFGGDPADKQRLRVEYHAVTLDEAIDLGSPTDAVVELAKLLNTNSSELVGPLQQVLSRLPASPPQTSFFGQIRHGLDQLISAADSATPSDAAHVYVTDILLDGTLKVDQAFAFDGKATVGIAFRFSNVKLLNIELLSAGVLLTVQIP